MTRLYRKARRNRVVAKAKTSRIKRLNHKPVISNVDIEEIKKEFANSSPATIAEKATPVKEKDANVVAVEESSNVAAETSTEKTSKDAAE